MRVTPKLIEEVTTDLVGEPAVPIIVYLKDKTKVSEFKVAEDTKYDIHEARTLLYKLYENNLATFIRKKDKKKGWYVCYWDFAPDKIHYLYKKIKQRKLSELETRLEREMSSGFYMCKHACTRMDFDKAAEFDYKCPECSQIMNPIDNSRTIETLHEKIRELKEEISTLA